MISWCHHVWTNFSPTKTNCNQIINCLFCIFLLLLYFFFVIFSHCILNWCANREMKIQRKLHWNLWDSSKNKILKNCSTKISCLFDFAYSWTNWMTQSHTNIQHFCRVFMLDICVLNHNLIATLFVKQTVKCLCCNFKIASW